MRRSALFALLLLQAPAAGPPIRYVPRLVDSTFTRRTTICPGANAAAAGPRSNDSRRPVADLLGPAASVEVNQVGTGFARFSAVRRYLTGLLAQRPRTSYISVPWAEGTPLREWGVLGTVHFTGGADARFEAVGPHLCIVDATGVGTWWRLAPVDVWPRP
jgi:hypothetical protein